MDVLADRVVALGLRLASTALVFAGGALLVAGIPTLSSVSGAVRDILIVLVEIGGVFALLGVAATYVLRPRPFRESHGPSGFGGWRLAFALTLLAVPAWLLLRLQPFLSEWREVALLLWSSDLWQTANANMSGVVLLPIAAELTPPFVELLALVAFVVSSLVMVGLLATKSARFSSLYVAAVLVLTALVVGSARGASAARMTAEALQPLIDESRPRPEEEALIRNAMDRYETAVVPTATALVWAWLGYAIWIPPVVLSSRRR